MCDLYLVPNNIESTAFVTADGVAHYQIRTTKSEPVPFVVRRVSRIQKPADSLEESIIADIEWGRWGTPATIRSPLLEGVSDDLKVHDFLCRKNQFSTSRYFLGNDNEAYQWKVMKEPGPTSILTCCRTGEEVARYTERVPGPGIFHGQVKSHLEIKPSALNRDLLVLSFIIVEKKRRDRLPDQTARPLHDEEPLGDGGGAGAEC